MRVWDSFTGCYQGLGLRFEDFGVCGGIVGALEFGCSGSLGLRVRAYIIGFRVRV